MFADADGGGEHAAPVLGGFGVVEGSQHHIVADECAVPEVNAALILEFAAHVDKDVFPDVDVFAAVGMEGREEPEALVHRLADELGEEFPQLLRRVVAGVDLGGDAQGLLADAVHELVGLTAALHRLSLIEMIQKCL